MRINLLDVGRTRYGDCLLVRSGERSILIDGAHPGDNTGSFLRNSKFRVADIMDGLSNTLFIGEHTLLLEGPRMWSAVLNSLPPARAARDCAHHPGVPPMPRRRSTPPAFRATIC